MILLFTSEHCTWCDMVRNMIENECINLGQEIPETENTASLHSLFLNRVETIPKELPT